MGPGATEQQKEVIAAVLDSPELASVVANMLREVGNDPAALAQYSRDKLEAALTALPAATATGAYADLSDSRKDFAPHRAYLFSVAPSKGTVLDELKTLLGEKAANRLAKDWKGSCNLNQELPATQVALFLDSNDKARNREYADRDAKTTQEEDFTATVHQFAGDLAATLLCARILRKAQDNVSLSIGEQDLYQKLKDGRLRSCSGALVIYVYGRLRANDFDVIRRSHCWALGSPLSPELEKT